MHNKTALQSEFEILTETEFNWDGILNTIPEAGIYVKWLEKKLTSDNSDYKGDKLPKLPSLHDVMDIVRPDGAGKEIPPMVRQVYNTIKKLGNFA